MGVRCEQAGQRTTNKDIYRKQQEKTAEKLKLMNHQTDKEYIYIQNKLVICFPVYMTVSLYHYPDFCLLSVRKTYFSQLIATFPQLHFHINM